MVIISFISFKFLSSGMYTMEIRNIEQTGVCVLWLRTTETPKAGWYWVETISGAMERKRRGNRIRSAACVRM